jgi:hypothetical protein
MDQRKADNRDANVGLAEVTASRLRFDSDEEVGMEVEETPEAEAEVIGSDNTSADYYFDSYSHFGTVCLISQRRYFDFSPAELYALGKNLILRVLRSGENARLLLL